VTRGDRHPDEDVSGCITAVLLDAWIGFVSQPAPRDRRASGGSDGGGRQNYSRGDHKGARAAQEKVQTQTCRGHNMKHG